MVRQSLFAQIIEAALFVVFLFFVGGWMFSLHFVINSQAAPIKYRETQKQGTFDDFYQEKQPAEPNALVDCGYGPAAPSCDLSVPRTCAPWSGGNDRDIIAATQSPGADGILHAWYDDETALTLGDGPVSAMNQNPGHVVNPNTGDPTAVDSQERPIRPALFITDITNNPLSRSGDWEYGGKVYELSEVFGSWKGYQGQNPQPPNGTNLGEGSVKIPVAPKNEYIAELRWNLAEPQFGLVKGHTYRLEFMFHDGDRSADVAEKCATITL